jgi:hypothetical protein
MSLVAQFLVRYPAVEGYTLIRVCEEINRETKAGIGVDGILTQALKYAHAGNYLARVCIGFQNQTKQENAQ